MSNDNALALFGDGTTPTTQTSTKAPKPKQERTPGPWSEGYDYDEAEGYFVLGRDADGNDFPIADVFSRDWLQGGPTNELRELPARANMEYIVLACNHFEKLRDACQAVYDLWLSDKQLEAMEDFCENGGMIAAHEQIRAAIHDVMEATGGFDGTN